MSGRMGVLLAAMMAFSVPPTQMVTLEYHLNETGYSAVELVDGQVMAAENGVRSAIRELRAPIEAMSLPYVKPEKVYTSPLEIEGVEQDIPFNYIAMPEQSALFVYSLVADGFRVSEYSATSKLIYIELGKDVVEYRILIYSNYLKVYMSEEAE